MNIEVIQEEKAFILYVDKAPAGRIDYQNHGGERFLIHTEIDPEFSGQGLARTLVEKVLEQHPSHRCHLSVCIEIPTHSRTFGRLAQANSGRTF